MKSRLKHILPLLFMVVFMACNRPDCNNGRRDGDETEIDCGGSCPDCPPSVTTNPVSSITTSSALLSMDYWHTTGTSKSSEGFIEKGFCYGTTANPTKDNFVTSTYGTFNASGDYSSSVLGLNASTTYYVRAFVVDKYGIAYGNEISFTTNSSGYIVTSDSVTEITSTNAICYGNAITVGGVSILQKGFCYGTTHSPTVTGSKTTEGPSTGPITSYLNGLLYSSTYYVRAYVIYSGGTIYGNEISFTTSGASIPAVSTSFTYSITTTSAGVQGLIIHPGGASVTSKGICYDINPNPTIGNSVINSPSGTTVISSILTNLTPNTTYYAKPYATNSFGTGYGNQISFTTNAITIGMSYQGGIVFFVDGSGKHGLIACQSDISSGIVWNNGTNINTNSYGSSIGTGQSNTNAIVSSQGVGSYAAKLCYDLTLNGYTDWYLPSLGELSELCINKGAVGFGGFSTSSYWSSTSFTSNLSDAGIVSFGSCSQGSASKSTVRYVRPIRSF